MRFIPGLAPAAKGRSCARPARARPQVWDPCARKAPITGRKRRCKGRPPRSARTVRDVVIVGAGVAGLAAAWSLRDLDVLVLEQSDRIGGRIRSERRGRYWLNFGAHVFAGQGTATDRLLRETGVETAEIPGVLTAVELDGCVVAGHVETYPFRLPLSLRERLALVRTGVRVRLRV